MTSRTPEGKHTKRFIVLEKNAEGIYARSQRIPQFFPTKEKAQEIVNTFPMPSEFRINQK